MTVLGFIGFGLIGASVAKSVKSKTPGKYEIIAYDYHTGENPALAKALSEKVVDAVTKKLEDLSRCDVVILCAPTLRNIAYLEKIKDAFSHACEGGDADSFPLITDVGSVKGNIVSAAERLGLGGCFIGGHPMAGSEKTGYDNAAANLLENSYYILTPAEGTDDSQLQLLKELVRDTGAISIVLDSKEHDRITAAISHVPHIIAVELVNLVQDSGEDSEKMKMLAAGGFKDITRIASSSPEMWRSILLSNKDAILDAMAKYQDALIKAEAAVFAEDGDYIYKTFERAGDFRNSIPNARGMLEESWFFYADIEDKAGAIAAVAGLLCDKGVSIKNIGIVNNRSFDKGVLRVELYDKDSKETAIECLKQNGYRVYI